MTPTLAGTTAAELFSQVDAAGRSLAGQQDVPDPVAALIDEIADRFSQFPEHQLAGVDPYLGQAFLSALLACEKGVRAAGQDERRRRVRIGIERVRQALRDIVEEAPSGEGQTTKELVRWLDETVSVSQSELADLVGVSVRTWQRWVSDATAAAPEDDDEIRVRAVARVVAHLRHVLTGPGVVRWFGRAHPDLGDLPPKALLADPFQLPRLARLAAGARSTLAS